MSFFAHAHRPTPFRSALGSSRSARDSSSIATNHAKLYLASSPGEYSALVMLVQTDVGMTIANVYGSFDPKVLGGSFNLPPPDDTIISSSPMPLEPSPGSVSIGGAPIESAPVNGTVLVGAEGDGLTRAMDVSIMQMTAYVGDASGQAFISKPDGPPPCQHFNYVIMVMGAQDGVFPIKPKGWKAGDRVPFTFDVSTMTPLQLTDLATPALWCNPAPPATAMPPAAAAAGSVVTAMSTSGDTSGQVWIIIFIVAALIGLAIYMTVRRTVARK